MTFEYDSGDFRSNIFAELAENKIVCSNTAMSNKLSNSTRLCNCTGCGRGKTGNFIVPNFEYFFLFLDEINQY